MTTFGPASGGDPARFQRSGERLIVSGACVMVAALMGWLATVILTSMSAQPDTVEDLTEVWAAAGQTRLGDSTTVEVPAGTTLVAFLVGTDLFSVAGTTTGDCSARVAGEPIELSWPVHIDRSITGLLTEGQQTVPVAGWTNTSNASMSVSIACDTADSTVDSFVAVPTRTGALEINPWYQPWGWVALAVLGGLLCAGGILRLPTVSD